MPARSRAAIVGGVFGWLAAALLAVALNRVVRSETVPILIGLQGVVQWALLPAFVLAALAIWRRRRWLAIVALLLCGTQLVWALGAIGWNGPQPLPEGDVKIRLLTANVLYTNEHIRELGDQLAAEDADVVLLQEVTDEVLAQLMLSVLWSEYRYRSVAAEPLYHGAVTFSRFPIVGSRSIDVVGYPMLLTDLQTADGTLRVMNVHTVAPLTENDASIWAAQFPVLEAEVAASPYPIVLAGDFNASLDHAPLEALVRNGVRDAFNVAGSGIGATWPRWELPVPQVMRLDHVLVSPSIDVGSLTDQLSIGSDHRHLVAEVGIPGANGT